MAEKEDVSLSIPTPDDLLPVVVVEDEGLEMERKKSIKKNPNNENG